MDNERYKEYDQVVYTVMMNVLAEHERCKNFIVYDFNLNNEAHRLYLNATLIAADLAKEKVYLKTHIIDYLRLKKEFNFKRKNLHLINFFNENKITNNLQTSVDILMNYIQAELKLDKEIFGEINREYYGG